jgi:apolipoprotein D and lipocalin family protein
MKARWIVPVMLAAAAAALLAGCSSGKPDNITPVKPFDANRYVGKWYEIARLDHSFERGLDNVTAQYSLRDDGGIKVINRGYNTAKGQWKDAEGKAYFVGQPDVGYLKVSFFGPFYGSYVVFDLDAQYTHSMISGPDTSYLWILSRTPTMDEATKKRLVDKAQALGFDTSKLIYVKHDKP